jgi:hypothetical protein
MATEYMTGVVTVTGANPQSLPFTASVDTTTGAGSTSVSYTGSSVGNDNLVATATIAGAPYTSNPVGIGWQIPDVTGWCTVNEGSTELYTFVVIAYFPNGNTGASKPFSVNAHHFNVAWTNVPGATSYEIYCTVSGGGTASYGRLTGVGSKTGGANSWSVCPTQNGALGVYMDDGTWYPYSGDGNLPPNNTTCTVPVNNSGTGNLVLSPSGASVLLEGGTVSLNIVISNIPFTFTSYVPLYEGVAGSLFITNNPNGGELMSFQTYNGNTVDPAAALQTFQLSGDNSAYQGLLTVNYSAPNYQLAYNGGAFVGNTATTTVTLTNSDVAWYNSANKSFDLYTVSSTGGGGIASVEFDYMVAPVVVSMFPTFVVNGGSYQFKVMLEKPLSPQQQGAFATPNSVTASASLTNGTVQSVNPIWVNGWLTGWTVNATIPASTTTTTCQLSMTVTGVLTYLQGTTIQASQSMTYITGAVGAPITAVSASATPPMYYSFSVTPVTAGTAPVVIPSTCTMTATVYLPTQDAVSLNFISRTNGVQSTLGPGRQISATTGTVQGSTVYLKTFQLTGVNPLAFSGTYLGYTATDSVNGQSATWFNSQDYSGVSTSGNQSTAPSGSGF